jgi:hypothetical protein
MSEHYLDIKEFLGTDNTSDLVSVSIPRKAGIFFYKLDNVDIDDNGKPHRRDGYGNPIYSGSSIRSLWANDKIRLFADDTNLKYMNADNATFNLVSGISLTDVFSYVENGDLIYFASDSIIGYIDADTATPNPFPDPAQDFKTRMVGGQILEFYNSRLYAANGCNLFFSDATVPTRMDTRKNAIAFPSRITMVKAVDNGIYVSDSNYVYFESGGDPSEFTERRVTDVPAIEGMSVTGKIKGKMKKKVVYWMTKKGIYAGFNSGDVIPQQLGLFTVDGLESGTAIIKEGTYQQLLMIGKY